MESTHETISTLIDQRFGAVTFFCSSRHGATMSGVPPHIHSGEGAESSAMSACFCLEQVWFWTSRMASSGMELQGHAEGE
eukprot:6451023-Prymnesium_polylepis.1